MTVVVEPCKLLSLTTFSLRQVSGLMLAFELMALTNVMEKHNCIVANEKTACTKVSKWLTSR